MPKLKLVFIISLLFNLLFISTTSIHYYQKKKAKELTESAKIVYDIPVINKQSIVFLGDSITVYGEWSKLFQNNNIINRGGNGITTKYILEKISTIVKDNPKKIFIMIGTNDLYCRKSISEIINNYKQILQIIKKESPNTEIYIQSILPINHKRENRSNTNIIILNHELKNLAIEQNVCYIDLHSSFLLNGELNPKYSYDGLHLNGEGYLLWKNLIEEYIN